MGLALVVEISRARGREGTSQVIPFTSNACTLLSIGRAEKYKNTFLDS